MRTCPTRFRAISRRAALVLVAPLLLGAAVQSPANAADQSLTTKFDTDFGNGAIAFDVDVLSATGVHIESFDANFSTAPDQSVSVYTRPGTHVGNLGSNAGWTLRGTVNLGATVSGAPTPVPVSFDLPQGTHGVAFITTAGLTYTSQPSTGDVAASNASLRIKVGTGVSNFGGFEIPDRLWNGTVYYSLLPVAAPVVVCNNANATQVGTAGNDIIFGTAGNDVISAGGGDDIVRGLGGDDIICGGDGNDRLKGGLGRDQLFGEAGRDKLNGGGAKDFCFGGPDRDALGCEKAKQN